MAIDVADFEDYLTKKQDAGRVPQARSGTIRIELRFTLHLAIFKHFCPFGF